MFSFLLKIILILFVTNVNSQGFEACPTIDILPKPFYLRGQACEGWWHNKVLITRYEDTKDGDQGDVFGYYQSICMTFNQDIELKNNNDEFIGKTNKQTILEWGTKIDIYDCNDHIVYVIEEGDAEVITNRLNPIQSILQIYNTDENGDKNDLIGYVEQTDLFDTHIDIQNMDEQIVISAVKSFSDNLGEIVCIDTSWTMTTFNSSDPIADPKIISFFVSLQEVKDLSNNSPDACTKWSIFGYVLLGIVIIIILIIAGCVLYSYFYKCYKNHCKNRRKNINLETSEIDDDTQKETTESS